MADFAYVARDSSGKKVTGTVDAGNQRDAAAQLAARSLFPIDVKPADRNAAAPDRLRSRKVKPQAMAIFYGQLASLLRSGVSMMRALTVLSEQASDKNLKLVLTDIRSRVEEGEPLGNAMARYPRVFSEMGTNMVRAGTEGGFLEDALERVSTFTELQEDLKGKTVSALAYPVFLFGVGSIVITVLIVFFVPKFDPLFARLRDKGEMPAITDGLLSFSKMLQSYGIFVVIAVIAIGFLIRMKLQTEEGKFTADKLKLKVPVLGEILMSLSVARFCRVLGTLLGNGVPILKSLEISRAATGNRLLSRSIGEASENIRAGENLATPLRASGYFPTTVVEMISVAEESNSLESVLPTIADSLEKRTFRRLDLFVRLLEPVMLLVMATLVLIVVMALLIPVIKSSSAI
ncbi:Putative type II secretion system protein F [Roseimaritima multifibrata]|uniref:Type II secretion system protein F n=1 Tax=Roseimaritima multifibrata TaxID=1930274 RepID=A0A517MNU8_9BACT|nr:type II secretion system F family protein [Roseimaritima multifibrata]QDS96551.1 Putative type II secretion system protein F [Roseimaritima multifibrata]